jgi:hypothetical protein
MISNTPHDKGKHIDDLRAAIEHRAAWLYELVAEAEKAGLDTGFAHRAIFNCGCFHGETKFTKTGDLAAFAREFANPNVREIFEMEVTVGDRELAADFHYCPLVASWLKLTGDEKKIAELCDIAMDGDRGIAARFGAFEFSLGQTIAKGDKICQIRFKKKN